MTYEARAHGCHPGIDYRADRPFIAWTRPQLLRGIEQWLRLNPPRLELATLALEELVSRGQNRAEAAWMLFAHAGLRPIPWLVRARQAVRSEFPRSATLMGRGRVYVILRDGYTEQNGVYGAYVGVTAKPVEKRFLEHRTGIRAARGLQEHGIELLYSLFDWINPIPGGRDARSRFETRLHVTLEAVIAKVTGDVCQEMAV